MVPPALRSCHQSLIALIVTLAMPHAAARYYSHVSRDAVAPGQAALINDVLQAHPNSVAAGSDFPDFM